MAREQKMIPTWTQLKDLVFRGCPKGENMYDYHEARMQSEALIEGIDSGRCSQCSLMEPAESSR